MPRPPRRPDALTDGGHTDDSDDPDPPTDGASPEGDEDDGWVPLAGLSQEGFLLVFAGVAAALASSTALRQGQPRLVVLAGGATALGALAVVVVDLLSELVPPPAVHLAVGGGASVAGAVALAGRHWVNAATFAVAAALVLYRAVDVAFRGAADGD